MTGGSSSSSSSNTTNNTNSQVSVGGENTGLILSNVSGSTIEVTDQGAIDAAFQLAGATLEMQYNNQTQAYEAINQNLNEALSFVETQNLPDNGLTVELIKPIAYASAVVALGYMAMRARG